MAVRGREPAPITSKTESGAARITRRVAESFFDANQLIVFGEPVGPGKRACLDLTAIGGDGEIGDCSILGLARTVRQDRRVAGSMRPLHRF